MPTAPLTTVNDYIKDARVDLLDTTSPYRYTDDELLRALNMALLEARRIRPDLYFGRWGSDVPYFAAVDSAPVPIEPQFRMGFVFGVVAYAMMRDDEDVMDARANSFYDKFYDILAGVRPRRLPTRRQSQQGAPTAEQGDS